MCVRPDSAWLPPQLGEPGEAWFAIRTRKFHNNDRAEMLASQYDFDYRVSDYTDFVERSGGRYRPDPSRTIEQNLVGLCADAVRRRFDVGLNVSSAMSLFSRNEIRDVVFMIRHPASQYASFGADHRHGENLEALGGFESDLAVDVMMERWRLHVTEYLRCRDAGLDPVMVRYEHAPDDVAAIAPLARLFEGHEARPRHELSERVESRIRAQTADLVEELYGQW